MENQVSVDTSLLCLLAEVEGFLVFDSHLGTVRMKVAESEARGVGSPARCASRLRR